MKAFVLTALLIGCSPRGLPTTRWESQLEPLGLHAAAGRLVTAWSINTAEPGVQPDGSVQLPAAWMDRWWQPSVVARVAHLVRHALVGVPDARVIRPCAAWRVAMFAFEVDGLVLEARVRAQLGRPIAPSSLGPALVARMRAYEARCPDALSAPRASPDDRQAP